MRSLEAGFEEKPESDEGIYQFHHLVAIKEGIANFRMDFYPEFWGHKFQFQIPRKEMEFSHF
jgi:hypothetical protein